MAKALKIAAIAVGVTALAFTGVGLAAGLGAAATSFGIGVSASTLFLVSAGLSVASAALTKAPTVPNAQTDRLTVSINPREPRKDVFGSTALPLDVRYEEWWGPDQDYCDWVVAHASHAIDGVDEIWINTDLAWTAAGGTTAKFAGYFSVPAIVLEGTGASIAVGSSGKWDASCRLTGCAYSLLRFKVTGNDKKAESPFAGGPPGRITIIGRGAKLYDPRRDSTVPGGSGPMRADDQSTWRFTTDGATIGENLPLMILRRLLGWRIRNPVTGEWKLATGSGLKAKRIDLQSFIVAANQADEAAAVPGGGTEPRYRGAGVVSEGEDNRTSLDAMCAACCGRFRDVGGKLSLALMHDDLALAATDDGLTTDDVLGGFTWDPDPSLEATPTVVRGKYIDATSTSLYQPIDYPEVSVASPDGIERPFPLELGYVESASQAQRVAYQVLMRKRLDRSFTAPFDIRAWRYRVGDIVPFTFDPLRFDRRIFRVKEQEPGDNNVCQMTLSAESHEIYAPYAGVVAPVQARPIVAYDPLKSPLIQGIEDAAKVSISLGGGGSDNEYTAADIDELKAQVKALQDAQPQP